MTPMTTKSNIKSLKPETQSSLVNISSLLVFIITNPHHIILQKLQRAFGNHVGFDVTLLVEQLSNPIGCNLLIPFSNLFKAISNQEFKLVVVHCRKCGGFNAGNVESVGELFRMPILIILFLAHSEHLSHLLFIIIGDVKDLTRHVSNFVKHWSDSSQHG